MKKLIGLSLLSLFLVGCSKEETPEIEDQNSPTEDIQEVDEEPTSSQPTKDNPLVIESNTLEQSGLTLEVDAFDVSEEDNLLKVEYTLTNNTHSPISLPDRVIANLSNGEWLTENLKDGILAPNSSETYMSMANATDVSHMDWFVIGTGDEPDVSSLMIVLPQ